MKILVFDAAPEQLLAAQARLAADSAEVLPARDVAAARSLAEQHDVALLLVDQDPLPADKGLQQLLGCDRLRGVPIVVLGSSAAQAAALHDVASAGFDFLLKPVPAPRLGRRLGIWLERAVQQIDDDEREHALQRLARLRAQMIDALSHDIRTPLSALLLNAELVARGSEAPGLRQAAQRMKSALSMLGLQIDHLVNAAGAAEAELHPVMRTLDLRALVQDRLLAFGARSPGTPEWSHAGEGDATAQVDATLIGDAIDGLLKVAAENAGAGPVNVAVDGRSRRSITLRIQFDAVLPDGRQQQFFGGAPVQAGPGAPRAAPALAEAESIVRAHGGTLIGRSKVREGTLFECMLPRGLD